MVNWAGRSDWIAPRAPAEQEQFIDDFGVNSHLIKREAILVGVPRSSV